MMKKLNDFKLVRTGNPTLNLEFTYFEFYTKVNFYYIGFRIEDYRLLYAYENQDLNIKTAVDNDSLRYYAIVKNNRIQIYDNLNKTDGKPTEVAYYIMTKEFRKQMEDLAEYCGYLKNQQDS